MNKLTRKSVSLLLSGTMVLGTAAPILANGGHQKETIQELKNQYSQTLASSESDFGFVRGMITTYKGSGGDVVIPSSIGGVTVTEIGSGAFDWNTEITTVTIPNTVTTIGERAFEYCENLTSVNIPSGVTMIDKRTFSMCSSLTSITIPDSVTSIGDQAFDSCSSLESITIPNNVTSIGDSSFSGCSFTNIIIPESVTSIGGFAFNYCEKLTSVTIPYNVDFIGDYAFRGCYELTSILVDGKNEHFVSEDGILFNKNKTNLICYPSAKEGDTYEIPNTVTSLGVYAISHCKYLASVIIPNSVVDIGYASFGGNGLFTNITLPEGVIYLDNEAFSTCLNLSEIYIPSSVVSIGEDVFGNAFTQENIPVTIKGVSGSYAQRYAIENGFHFVSESGEIDQDKDYHQLENATLHTSYLSAIHDINTNSTLISGNLPKGLGLYEDGVIGGIPQETGTFEFVIATSEGEVGYSITVEEPTAQNVEANNDFDIIERVPTVDSNEKEYIFEVTGEFSDFLNVYLDGELLVKDVHYFSEEGSTKITIAAQTMSQLDSGSHVINATFATTNATVTPSVSSGSTSSSGSITTNSTSQSANVSSVAQVFEKTVEPAPLMAMPFTDVAVSDWHYQYVRYMYDTSTFSGVTDTTYEPNTGMTRAMMAVVFYGMADKPSTGSAGFSDVADGEWYADAVNWVSASGIDDSVGTFRPTDLITREETAKMMYNFCTDQGIFIPLTTSRTPSDMNSVSENAKNAVNILFSKGIFSGDDANNFNPHNTSTRAEISAMMRTFMWATV